ncbi:MAG: 4Fe-4S binding protein [Verrucomicrobia bacterium]|nr:4Fe-4S binding protein [Verrucomicrobiota bacterium]
MTTGENGRHKRLRLAARWLALAAGAALVLPWWTVRVPLASFSPFVALCSALATHAVGLIVLLGVPAFVLALMMPRWFCRFACPVGFMQELLGGLRPHAKTRWLRWPFFGRWFLLLTLGGALVGYPIFLWLDPLAIFSGFFSAWRQPLTIASVCAGLALPVALLFDFLLPKAWCMRVCPLGAMQELMVVSRRLIRPRMRCETGGGGAEPHPHHSMILARRSFLAACIGVTGAVAARKVRGGPPLLRPPGALDEERFTGVCVRCGDCTRVCPTRILKPDLGEHGLAGLLAPVAKFDDGYCKEDCNRCGQVCPSGAIERLPLAEKRRRVIGPAKVDLETCLLANGQDCTACIRACPYEALKVLSDGFDTRPELILARCTGCGACETACPVRPHRAIRVVPKPGVLPA